MSSLQNPVKLEQKNELFYISHLSRKEATRAINSLIKTSKEILTEIPWSALKPLGSTPKRNYIWYHQKNNIPIDESILIDALVKEPMQVAWAALYYVAHTFGYVKGRAFIQSLPQKAVSRLIRNYGSVKFSAHIARIMPLRELPRLLTIVFKGSDDGPADIMRKRLKEGA